MDGLSALLTKLQLDPQIKVRGVYANECSRSGLRHICNHAFAKHQQLRQTRQHFHVTTNGQHGAVMPGIKPGSNHLVTTDTEHRFIGVHGFDFGQNQRGNKVTGRFTGQPS